MRWKRVDCLGKSCGGDSGSGRRRRGGRNKMEMKKVVVVVVQNKTKQCSNRSRSRFSTFIFQVSDTSVLASVSLRIKND